MREKGQAVIILLLIMLVALTIGLAITQRSLTDISTSNKGEESSRAFSAAEAGIEQALQTGVASPVTNLGNNSGAVVNISNALPTPSQLGAALELPPISKSTTAQIWLASGFNTPGVAGLTPVTPPISSLQVYFGDPVESPTDQPAIEVNILSQYTSGSIPPDCSTPAGGYMVCKYFFDSNSSRSGSTGNGFTPVTCSSYSTSIVGVSSVTSPTTDNFYCTATVNTPGTPILARIRLFYSNANQKIAVLPGGASSLPSQAQVYTSVGTSGQTRKTVQVLRLPKVIPQLFDFALFSVGPIQKCDGC